MESVLITGASGFIGSSLLKSFDQTVPVLGVDLAPTAGVWPLDLTDVFSTSNIMHQFRPATIIHLAGATVVGKSSDINKIIWNTLAASLYPLLTKNYKPHIIVAGSAVEYGSTGKFQERPTEHALTFPEDPYAQSKLDCTTAALNFASITGCSIAVVRLANVYGPGQKRRFIPVVIENIAEGRKVTLHGDGRPVRQFVYVDDVCRAVHEIMRQRARGIFNLGAEPAISMRDLVKTIVVTVHDFQMSIGETPKPASIELQPTGGGAMHVAVDYSRAIAQLGWCPSVPLDEGLRRTVVQQLGDRRENRERRDGVISSDTEHLFGSPRALHGGAPQQRTSGSPGDC